MKILEQLDGLNLDATAKTQVVGMLQSLLDQVKTDAATIQAKDLKIQALVLELSLLRRMRYGARSEALSQIQRDLFEEAFAEDLASLEAKLEDITDETPQTTVTKPKRPRAGRQPLPEHLPRIEHCHEPDSCLCGQCGKALVKIGDDITEQLDVEPAKFFVHRHIRPQYACRSCETVTAAPIPPAVIDGGLAAVGLLSWVLVSKYVDHLPLYRLEQIAARDRVNLPRSSLAEWVGRTGVAMQPLVDRMTELLLKRSVLHVDETPVSQLDPGRGKTKKAYLWVYRSNDLQAGPKIVVFDYRGGRSGEYARQFLGDWVGHLLVDDFSGYKALFSSERQEANPCIELGCWAHSRRKFFDLHNANGSTVALEALARIGKLYDIEQQGKTLDIDARKRLRTGQSKTVLAELLEWLTETRAKTANGGGLAKALDYTLRRWSSLIRYADTGHLPIDNNPVENTIRPAAIGKKNWLFIGSEPAGVRAAAIQSLLGTARLNGLNPAAWLKDTLEKLPAWPNSRIDELLPFPISQENVKTQLENNG